MNPHDITYNLDITHRELAAIEAWHKQVIADLREYADKCDNYNIKIRIERELLQRQERCIQLSTTLPAT